MRSNGKEGGDREGRDQPHRGEEVGSGRKGGRGEWGIHISKEVGGGRREGEGISDEIIIIGEIIERSRRD